MFGYLYRGLSNFELNFIEESSDDFRKAFERLEKNKFRSVLNEYTDFIKYRIAWNLRKQRKYEQAIQYLDEALEESSKGILFYKLKADIYNDQEKLDLALDSVNAAFSINPKDKELVEYRNVLIYEVSANRMNKSNG